MAQGRTCPAEYCEGNPLRRTDTPAAALVVSCGGGRMVTEPPLRPQRCLRPPSWILGNLYMNDSISAESLARYFRVLEEGCRSVGDWEFLEETLDRHPDLAPTRLPLGGLPLRMLLRHRSPPGLFVLLAEHGAEHDIMTACAATDVEAVDRLLLQGPHLVHETDEEDNTPLHWACVQRGYARQPCDTVGLVQRLVAAGSDVNAQNSLGLTPLHCNILDGNGEACELLIEHDAIPNVLLGVVSEDYELLDAILDREPDQIHWRQLRSGRSLLHLAVQWECEPRMFEYLVARGARGTRNPVWPSELYAAIAGHPHRSFGSGGSPDCAGCGHPRAANSMPILEYGIAVHSIWPSRVTVWAWPNC